MAGFLRFGGQARSGTRKGSESLSLTGAGARKSCDIRYIGPDGVAELATVPTLSRCYARALGSLATSATSVRLRHRETPEVLRHALRERERRVTIVRNVGWQPLGTFLATCKSRRLVPLAVESRACSGILKVHGSAPKQIGNLI